MNAIGRIAIGLLLSSAAVGAFAQDTAAGLWKTIDDATGHDKSLVRITAEGGVYTGRIDSLLDPQRAPTTVCEKCTDDRKGQPLIGLANFTVRFPVLFTGNIGVTVLFFLHEVIIRHEDNMHMPSALPKNVMLFIIIWLWRKDRLFTIQYIDSGHLYSYYILYLFTALTVIMRIYFTYIILWVIRSSIQTLTSLSIHYDILTVTAIFLSNGRPSTFFKMQRS